MTDRPTAIPGWAGLVSTFAGMLTAQMAAGMVAVVVIVALSGISGISDVGVVEALEGSLPVVAASTITLQLTLAAFAIGTPMIARVRVASALGLRGAPAVAFPAAIVGALALGPLGDTMMSVFSALLPDFTLGALTDMLALFRENAWWALWPFIALLPGFCEELLFRGLLQRALGNGALAIAVASVLFALMHVDPPHVVGVLPLGVYLGWVAARTDSLWVPIAVHVANNTFALLAVHVDALHVGYGTDTPMPWWWVPAGLVIAAACVAVIALSTRRSAAPVSQAGS